MCKNNKTKKPGATTPLNQISRFVWRVRRRKEEGEWEYWDEEEGGEWEYWEEGQEEEWATQPVTLDPGN